MSTPFERGRALSYVHNWAILPLATRTSWQPLNSNGHNGATDDEDTIAAWMKKWPTANYGICPKASGLVVLDFDRNHKNGGDGVSTWQALLDKHNGGRPLPTFTVQTPGDGLHLYFIDPGFSVEDNNTPKGKAAVGVDIKWNGYVAGPGCVRDQTTRDDGSIRLGGEYKLISRRDILPAEMPEWLVRWISRERPQTKIDPNHKAKASDHDTVKRVVYMAGVLSRVPEGSAQEWINRECFKIGQYIGAGQITKQEVMVRFSRALRGWNGYERILDHIDRQLDAGSKIPRPWLSTKPEPAKKPAEPAQSIKDEAKAILDTPDPDDEDDMFSDPEDEVSERDQLVDELVDQMEIRMLAKLKLAAKYRTSKPVSEQLMDVTELRNLPQPEPLIDQIMSRGASTLLYAGTNVGKSVVALDMAMSVATGHPWLDRFRVHKGRVLWIAGEGVYSLLGRMKAWQYRNKVMLRPSQGDVFKVIPNSIVFASEEQVAETVAMVRDGQFDLVVIDTLAMNSVGFNENAPVEMTAWWNEVIKLRSECERLAILVLHHEGKGTANQNTTFKEPRGATSIKDVPETVIRLSISEGSKSGRDIEITKQRDMPSLGKRLYVDIEKEPKSGEPVVVGKPDPDTDEDGVLLKENSRTKLMRYFRENFSETGVTQAKLYGLVTEQDIIKKSTFYNAVNQLIKDKELVSTKRGSGVYLTLRGHLDNAGEDDL